MECQRKIIFHVLSVRGSSFSWGNSLPDNKNGDVNFNSAFRPRQPGFEPLDFGRGSTTHAQDRALAQEVITLEGGLRAAPAAVQLRPRRHCNARELRGEQVLFADESRGPRTRRAKAAKDECELAQPPVWARFGVMSRVASHACYVCTLLICIFVRRQ